MKPLQANDAVLPLRDVEAAHIRHALQVSNWNKRQAARALGISRDTLYRKIAEHRLAPGPRPADGAPERLA